jgi:dUTP pyrophosphatase
MVKVEFRGQYGKVEYKTKLSAGADLCAQPPSTEEQAHSPSWRCGHTPARWVLEPGEWCCIPTGLFIVEAEVIPFKIADPKLPTGFSKLINMIPYLEVTPRSGLALRSALSSPNSPALIDCDFRSEICVIPQNLGYQPIVIELGDRIAQIKGCYAFKIDGLSTLDIERGANGFGSSGIK